MRPQNLHPIMLKKVILLLLIGCIAVSGFAQKSKRKSSQKNPKNNYFVMLINGEETPAYSYCPGDSILFDFAVLDHNIKDFTYCWSEPFHHINICDSTPIKIAFPITTDYPSLSTFKISITFMPKDTTVLKDTLTLTTEITVDFIRTIMETNVCQGRDITITTNTHGDFTITNVQNNILDIPPDTLQSATGCDSLVHWHVIMDPYVEKKHEISSCDSVVWEDIIIKRPDHFDGDYKTTVERIYFANDPNSSCDTLKILTVIIIDTNKDSLSIRFDQKAFCDGPDMGGELNLETNFTAFYWTHVDTDSSSTVFEKNYPIEYPGTYIVRAYMDTSLYDTLKNLRIVNCFLMADTLVTDCDLVIPNVITPGNDGKNDVLGIKKLNPARENELTIYDRWGKTVFHQKNYKCIFKGNQYLNIEDAFDGKSRSGQKLPDGIYHYAFKYAAIPKGKTYTGAITILNEK